MQKPNSFGLLLRTNCLTTRRSGNNTTRIPTNLTGMGLRITLYVSRRDIIICDCWSATFRNNPGEASWDLKSMCKSIHAYTRPRIITSRPRRVKIRQTYFNSKFMSYNFSPYSNHWKKNPPGLQTILFKVWRSDATTSPDACASSQGNDGGGGCKVEPGAHEDPPESNAASSAQRTARHYHTGISLTWRPRWGATSSSPVPFRVGCKKLFILTCAILNWRNRQSGLLHKLLARNCKSRWRTLIGMVRTCVLTIDTQSTELAMQPQPQCQPV